MGTSIGSALTAAWRVNRGFRVTTLLLRQERAQSLPCEKQALAALGVGLLLLGTLLAALRANPRRTDG